MSWRSEAACLGKPPSWFFPSGNNAAFFYKKALEVCAGCPVVDQCQMEHKTAERELDRSLPGVWGGRVFGAHRRLRRAS